MSSNDKVAQLEAQLQKARADKVECKDADEWWIAEEKAATEAKRIAKEKAVAEVKHVVEEEQRRVVVVAVEAQWITKGKTAVVALLRCKDVLEAEAKCKAEAEA